MIKPSQLKKVRQRNYLAKDFDSLKDVILNYAQLYYPDRITDFSENSLGGLFLDMAAYVGDNMSFYLDHQFNELDPESVVEAVNLQKLLRSANVKAKGASPALATCTFLIEVPPIYDSTLKNWVPAPESLPVIKAGSIFSTANGINFSLLNDVNFSQKDGNGDYIAEVKNGKTSGQQIVSFYVTMEGTCISGFQKSTTFTVSNFVPFRKLTLPESDVYEIVNVTDSNGNVYYEVNDLSEDVVYTNIKSSSGIDEDVLQIIPAPFRFIKNYDLVSGLTTLTFGGGNADSLEDDVIPDPSEFAIPLPNTKFFSRSAINPNKLLSTRTLGVAAENVNLIVNYRFGGGLSHNVGTNSIKIVKSLEMFFPLSPTRSIGQSVTNSLEVSNQLPASGGENAPTSDELKQLIPTMRLSQDRIVSKDDLLARIYTLPSNFGRVFRAAVRSNKDNPLATKLFIVSRDSDGYLTTSSDVLKENLVKYLNSYRMISDAIDILDSPVINFRIKFSVIVDPKYNSSLVIKSIISELLNFFGQKNMQIDKPINISEVLNVMFSVDGVISVPSDENSLQFYNIKNSDPEAGEKVYSDFSYDLKNATIKQKNIIIPPEGGIFELRYPIDIQGQSV